MACTRVQCVRTRSARDPRVCCSLDFLCSCCSLFVCLFVCLLLFLQETKEEPNSEQISESKLLMCAFSHSLVSEPFIPKHGGLTWRVLYYSKLHILNPPHSSLLLEDNIDYQRKVDVGMLMDALMLNVLADISSPS